MNSKYQNGKIYKIVSKNTDMIYIGSTKKVKLKTRMNEHRCAFKKGEEELDSHYMFLWDDAEIKLIEDYPCKSKKELTTREQYYMDLYPDYIVNTRKASSDKKEQNRLYMRKRRAEGTIKEDTEKEKERKRKSYLKHREKQLEKSKQYREDFRAEKNEMDRKYNQYTRSWGGDKRYNNNMLQIKLDIFK